MSSSSSSSSKSKTSYTRPEGFDRAQDITNDLEEYGCSIEHVKKALAMKDQPIDALAQMPRRTLKAAEEPPGEIVTVARGDRVGRGNANAKSAYEHLYLREGTSEWPPLPPGRRARYSELVLTFEPKTGFSSILCAATPALAPHVHLLSSIAGKGTSQGNPASSSTTSRRTVCGCGARRLFCKVGRWRTRRLGPSLRT